MSDVDRMIEDAAMALLDCDEDRWDRMPQAERASVEAEVEDALKSLNLPLETLAALKAGEWKAVPVVETLEMRQAAVSAEDHGGDGDAWAAKLAAAPSKPGDGE